MKTSFIVAAALALPTALASATQQFAANAAMARATTTIMTTSYTTYVYTVYDSSSTAAASSYGNNTSSCTTTGASYTHTVAPSASVSPSIAPVPKGAAGALNANVVLAAAAAGIVALAL